MIKHKHVLKKEKYMVTLIINEKFVKTTVVKFVQMRAEQLELNAIDSRKRYVGLPRQAGWAKWAYLGWAVLPIYRDGVSTY